MEPLARVTTSISVREKNQKKCCGTRFQLYFLDKVKGLELQAKVTILTHKRNARQVAKVLKKIFFTEKRLAL